MSGQVRELPGMSGGCHARSAEVKELHADLCTYCSQVGDGRVVRVSAAGPHGVDQDLAKVQQYCHLQGTAVDIATATGPLIIGVVTACLLSVLSPPLPSDP